jgi:integrase
MLNSSCTIGNESDTKQRISARLPGISRAKLKNLTDLLNALDVQGSDMPIPMLRTTAGHLSKFLNRPTELIPIDSLEGLGPEFRNYLQEHRYKRNAVRSYSNYLGMLVKAAKEFGWESSRSAVADEWKGIDAVLAKCGRGFSTIIAYAIRNGKTPPQLSDEDLAGCCQMLLNQGHSFQSVRAIPTHFRRSLKTLGLLNEFPNISPTHQNPRYGIPIRLFPEVLRLEVEAFLSWKQAPYVEGRPRRGRHRAVTAKGLGTTISALYGFAVNVEKRQNITSLIQLVTRESVLSFIKWLLNDRRLKSEGVSSRMGGLFAAMRWNPAYKNQDLSWFPVLLSQIPLDSESQKPERKESKYLPYETVADIPRMLRARRKEVSESGQKKLAFLVHDELLISWLVTLVWRQRNIRECQIGHNLFKAEVPALASIARPKWVEERLLVDPRETFWQFNFREPETKTGHEVRSILPRRLVPLLEEYLERHRPNLLNGGDHGYLFMNRVGNPLTAEEVTHLVSDLTMRYKHRNVTPHLFRDIFAYWWLERHPEDFLTLSKMLWHRNINTTLRIYGGRFDESHGLRRVEEWIESHEQEDAHDLRDPHAKIEAPEIRKAEPIPDSPEVTGLREPHGMLPGLDYEAEYRAQREINKNLVDRIRQLEKQLTERSCTSQSANSEAEPKIRPGKVKSQYRRTG